MKIIDKILEVDPDFEKYLKMFPVLQDITIIINGFNKKANFDAFRLHELSIDTIYETYNKINTTIKFTRIIFFLIKDNKIVRIVNLTKEQIEKISIGNDILSLDKYDSFAMVNFIKTKHYYDIDLFV
jgi:hypothetical protein